MAEKPRFIQCICTGECPGFKDLNVWQLVNFVRNELDVEYAVVHPQLCVEDGDRFLEEILKPGVKYVIGACDPRMQKKMLRDAFEKTELSFDDLVTALDLRNMTTEEAMAQVKEALDKVHAQLSAATEGEEK